MTDKRKEWVDELIRYGIVLLVSLIIGGLLIYLRGENPFTLAIEVFGHVFGSRLGIASTLRWAAPVIITGMGGAVAARIGIANLGLEGQLYVAALATAILGYRLQGLPPFTFKIVITLGGMIMAAAFALIPATLYIRWGVNEVLSTLMLNYVAILGTEWIVKTFLMEESARVVNLISTPEIRPEAQLSSLMPPYDLTISLVVGIVLCIVFYLIYGYTSAGYSFNTLGGNRKFARYGGMEIKKIMLLTFALSGAIAGLAGSMQVMGVHRKFINGFSASIGWDGLLVGWLAQNNPILILVFGLFWGLLKNVGFMVERVSDVSRWSIYVMQAVLVLLITAKFNLRSLLKKLKSLNLLDGGKQ
jgi:general nucleoside transport system permease protein